MLLDLNRVLEQIEKDKGIPKESLIEAIEAAMMSAARKKLGFLGELEAHYNEEVGEVELFEFKTVAEKIENPHTEITMEEAKKLDAGAVFGDSIGQKVDANKLGRIAAQTAKQVIIQKLRDAERDIVFQEYKDRVGQILSGIVRRFEKGNIVVELGKTEAIVPYKEQIPGESYKAGDRIQTYFVSLNNSGRGSQIILSRRHPQLIKSLFEMEVPEIAEGIVEIKNCAREPGIRAKVAVYSKDSDVDPVGACVGMKGSRVQSVVQELRGEKIDIVLWDKEPAKFVCNAIAPAEVSKVIIKEAEKAMEIIVADDQLSLAIGKKGQNVRLAANLTGWNIDIFSETKIEEMAKQSKERLVKFLGVDDATATVLYSHAFRSVEEIYGVGLDAFLGIPGMNQEVLKEIFKKAEHVIKNGPPVIVPEKKNEEEKALKVDSHPKGTASRDGDPKEESEDDEPTEVISEGDVDSDPKGTASRKEKPKEKEGEEKAD